jgi:adenylate cyclase
VFGILRARADTYVDTRCVADVDFAAEGLLKGLRGNARAARLRLLERLHADGVSLGELREAVEEDRLILLPAERVVAGRDRYTGLEIAEMAGLDLEFLLMMRRAHGLPTPDPAARVFTDIELDGARNAKAFLDAGLPPEDMIEVTRVLGRGLAQATEAMRAVALKLVLRPGAGEDELAYAFADVAARLTPLTGPMVAQMTKLHLRRVIQTEVLNVAEREAGILPGARDVGVAFADLVGFTRLGEQVPPDELGRVALQLDDLAADVIAPPVRIVKSIGDAVMFVCPETAPLVGASLRLVEAADSAGEDFPQLRVGVAAGPALSRAGDWYGRPVNLASRVTDIAWPSSVLVTDEVRETAGDAYSWSFAGKRKLKGVPQEVPLFRARELAPESG